MYKTDHHRAHGCLRVIGLQLTETEKELLYLLVFVWNLRSERQPTCTEFVENIGIKWQ